MKKRELTAAANFTERAPVPAIADLLPVALIDASSGISTTAREPVSDEGVNSRGMTIPEALPNSAVACSVVSPYKETRRAGRSSDVSVLIELPTSLVAVSGAALMTTFFCAARLCDASPEDEITRRENDDDDHVARDQRICVRIVGGKAADSPLMNSTDRTILDISSSNSVAAKTP